MNDLVVDASFIGLVHLPDELPPTEAAELQARLFNRNLYVPSHWHLEICNMMVKAERRGRIDRPARERLLQDLRHLPVRVDSHTFEQAWSVILPLADAHGLTVYDAAYLELASRLGAALASHDKRLVAAGRTLSLEMITIYS